MQPLDHIRLLMDCAQLCTTSADYMARGSSFHDRTCGLCSEVYRIYMESCECVAGDDQDGEAVRRVVPPLCRIL